MPFFGATAWQKCIVIPAYGSPSYLVGMQPCRFSVPYLLHVIKWMGMYPMHWKPFCARPSTSSYVLSAWFLTRSNVVTSNCFRVKRFALAVQLFVKLEPKNHVTSALNAHWLTGRVKTRSPALPNSSRLAAQHELPRPTQASSCCLHCFLSTTRSQRCQ